jgi:hypothetical protein
MQASSASKAIHTIRRERLIYFEYGGLQSRNLTLGFDARTISVYQTRKVIRKLCLETVERRS